MRSTVFTLALVLLSTGAAAGQDVDTIIQKGLDALGGADRLKALQVRSFSGDALFNGGAVSGTFKVVQARPDRLRLEIDVNGNQLVQGSDGASAWQIQPVPFGGTGEPETLQGPAADAVYASAEFESPLIDYRTKGHSIELVGTEKVGDQDVYHLKVTRKSGRVTHIFLDTTTYLGVKTITKTYNAQAGGEIEVEQLTSDYREVDGIMVPYELKAQVEGQTVNQLIVRNVDFGAKLDDALFRKPGSR